MTTPYIAFHLAFVLPALLVVAILSWRRETESWARSLRLGLPVLVGLAVAYTTPWDNYLIARGVWSYAEGAALARIGLAPVEEYAFFVLQTLLVGLWLTRFELAEVSAVTMTLRDRVFGVGVATLLGALGLLGFVGNAELVYMGAIVAWAAPIFALQWAFGWRVLVRARRTVAIGVLVPTLYLSIADRVAIDAGIWTLSTEYTSGIAVLGLPVEEGLFFLVTSLFIVQGLVLLRWALAVPRVAVPPLVRQYVGRPDGFREEVPE